MREQKSRANWLNTENARCHRTVYITMQNVTSKLQIGLSPEMGWHPVSFTIIVNKDVWMCTPGRCSWALFKDCLRPLRFSLDSRCHKFSVLTTFHMLSLLLFPLLHFQRPRREVQKQRKQRHRIVRDDLWMSFKVICSIGHVGHITLCAVYERILQFTRHSQILVENRDFFKPARNSLGKGDPS